MNDVLNEQIEFRFNGLYSAIPAKMTITLMIQEHIKSINPTTRKFTTIDEATRLTLLVSEIDKSGRLLSLLLYLFSIPGITDDVDFLEIQNYDLLHSSLTTPEATDRVYHPSLSGLPGMGTREASNFTMFVRTLLKENIALFKKIKTRRHNNTH